MMQYPRVLAPLFFSAIAAVAITNCSVEENRSTSQPLERKERRTGARSESASAIVLAPQNIEGIERLLIIFPGMKKSATEYETLAQQIQGHSRFKLWVGIVKFQGNITNPLQAESLVTNLLGEVRSMGFANAAPEHTSIAGHSLGGIIAQKYITNRGFSSLILLSSYLTRSQQGSSLPGANLPVLTLSGELDGQTRLTRIALDAKGAADLAASTSENIVARDKPVVVLPKVNHSQFSGPVRLPSDFDPEIEYTEAQSNIGSIVADFMLASDKSEELKEEKNAALERVAAAVLATRILLNPYWAAQKKDQIWCAETQRVEAMDAAQKYTLSVDNTIFENDREFAQSKPQAAVRTDNTMHITAGTRLKYADNSMDISTTPEAAETIACKNKSREALNNLASLPTDATTNCQEQNAKAFAWALSEVSPTVRERFLRRGRQLQFAWDREVGSGIQWLPASLSFENDANSRIAVVTSTALRTGLNAPMGLAGMHYCKLLSPTRAMEWILVDSLRD